MSAKHNTRTVAAWLLGLSLALPVPGHVKAQTPSLNLVCIDTGAILEACRASAARYTEATGVDVEVVSADAFGRRSLVAYRTLLDVESPRLDVLQFPGSWAYALAPDLSTLDAALAPPPVAALEDIGVVSSRRVGLAQTLAVTLIFLRDDVFDEPPKVWQELRDGLVNAPPDGATGLSFGASGGALFPFFMDWIYSFGATGLTDRAAVQEALEALDQSLGLIASETLASASTQDAIDQFVSGRSAALVAPSTAIPRVVTEMGLENVRAAVRPRSRAAQSPKLMATVWLFGVSQYSDHPGHARDLVDFLVSKDEQRQIAEDFGIPPMDTSLYADEDFLTGRPLMAGIASRLDELVPGPVTTYGIAYLDLAQSVAEAVRIFIQGDTTVGETMAAITGAVVRARRQIN